MTEPWHQVLVFWGFVFPEHHPAHRTLLDLTADAGAHAFTGRRVRLGVHGPLDAPRYHVSLVCTMRELAPGAHDMRVPNKARVGPIWEHDLRTWCRLRGVSTKNLVPAWHVTAVFAEP